MNNCFRNVLKLRKDRVNIQLHSSSRLFKISVEKEAIFKNKRGKMKVDTLLKKSEVLVENYCHKVYPQNLQLSLQIVQLNLENLNDKNW